MFCDNCGKENTAGNNFCEYCGQPLAVQQSTPPNMPEYQWSQMDSETQNFLEQQKIEKVKKSVKRRTNASSVIWLISGIILCEMVIWYVCNLIYFFNDGEHHFIDYLPLDLCAYSLWFVMLTTGIIGILNFIKYKSKKKIWYQNKFYMPKVMLLIQIAYLTVICLSGDITGYGGILYSIIEFLFRRIRLYKPLPLFEDIFTIVLFIIFALPIAASLIDVINAAVIKKNNDIFKEEYDNTPKKRGALLRVVTGFMCFAVVCASVFRLWGIIAEEMYYNEQKKIINIVQQGHLEGYSEKTIQEAAEDMSKAITKWNLISSWRYSSDDPQYRKYYFPVSKDIKRYRYIEASQFGDESKGGEDLSITFKLDTADNSIEVFELLINDITIQNEKDKFIDEYFSDNSLYVKGDEYKKNGVYVPNTQTLYREPNLGTSSGYTYKNSGTKTVYDYRVVKNTLWLKVSVYDLDEGREYYWIPAPENDY